MELDGFDTRICIAAAELNLVLELLPPIPFASFVEHDLFRIRNILSRSVRYACSWTMDSPIE